MDVRFEWTTAAVERAIVMWNDGAGAQQIADELGTTRNSVIGKMHRTSKVRDDIKKYENPVLKGKSGDSPTPTPTPKKKPPAEAKKIAAAEVEPAPIVAEIEAPVETAEIEADAGSVDDLPWHPSPLFEQKEPVLERPAKTRPMVNDNGGVSFLDVKSCQCRWPMWGDQLGISIEDKRFCGKRTETVTSSWCPEHADRLLVR